MEHIGMFDPAFAPVKSGGLSEDEIAELLQNGWEMAQTETEVADVVLTFSDQNLPGNVTMKKVNIPAGVNFLKNRDSGLVMMSECGNLGGLWGD